MEPERPAARAVRRPYGDSYFLPGKLAGHPVHFLIDTGCTTNLLGKHVFDRLNPYVRSQMEECDSHGVMADGTSLPFYGVLRANKQLRDAKAEDAFVISQISEDVILGMPFLTANQCAMEFGRPILRMGNRELVCTDRHGRLLVSSVQVIRDVTIPTNSEMIVQGRVTARQYPAMGMVEARPDGPMVAASFNQPDERGRLFIRCLNPTGQLRVLTGGSVLGSYSGVHEDMEQQEDIRLEGRSTDSTPGNLPSDTPGRRHRPPPEPDSCPRRPRPDPDPDPRGSTHRSGVSPVPVHIHHLYEAAAANCDKSQGQELASLMTEFADVFSSGDFDMGQTDLVQHGIPVAPGPSDSPLTGWDQKRRPRLNGK